MQYFILQTQHYISLCHRDSSASFGPGFEFSLAFHTPHPPTLSVALCSTCQLCPRRMNFQRATNKRIKPGSNLVMSLHLLQQVSALKLLPQGPRCSSCCHRTTLAQPGFHNSSKKKLKKLLNLSSKKKKKIKTQIKKKTKITKKPEKTPKNPNKQTNRPPKNHKKPDKKHKKEKKPHKII